MIKFARRKRRNRNFLRRSRGGGITPGLSITSVQARPVPEQVRIFFSGAVAWNGADVPSAFKADTSDGPLDGCINVLAVGANYIEVEFNGAVSVGANWIVDGPMAGVGPPIAWPQAGVVSA
jgi:hypothetical protein